MTVLNEREYRKAKTKLDRLKQSLQSPTFWEAVRIGFSPDTIEAQRSALEARIKKISADIEAYDELRRELASGPGSLEVHDLGLLPIVARIGRGWSQRELAERLGIKEQQIQRYEAERYASIKLSSYKRVLAELGIEASGTLLPIESQSGRVLKSAGLEISSEALREVNERGWLSPPGESTSVERSLSDVRRYVTDKASKVSGPVLLRGSVRSKKNVDPGALQVWRARIIDLAEKFARSGPREFDFVDISWVRDLVRLSVLPDGPLQAAKLLEERGVIFVVERHLSRTYLDGAAFLFNDRPVIGLTIRFDRLDNFWFTLLHELGHVFLHHSAGLEEGFFDNMEEEATDQVEHEADNFALDALIPREMWKTSPARFAKTIEPMRKFAQSIGVHEAIVVGRVRRERNYSLLSEFVGQGQVRNFFGTPEP
jgi:HTH-type transcriptional regulator / antitoxin HigA